MAYSIHHTARFNEQIEGTVEYLLHALCSPQAAKSLLDEYERALQLIRNTHAASRPALTGGRLTHRAPSSRGATAPLCRQGRS